MEKSGKSILTNDSEDSVICQCCIQKAGCTCKYKLSYITLRQRKHNRQVGNLHVNCEHSS